MSLQISDVWIPSHCLPRKSTTSPAELDKIENLYNCKNFNSVEYFFGMTFFASLWAAFYDDRTGIHLKSSSIVDQATLSPVEFSSTVSNDDDADDSNKAGNKDDDWKWD